MNDRPDPLATAPPRGDHGAITDEAVATQGKREVGPLGAILLPGPVLVTGLLAMQAITPSDAINAGMFLAAPLAAAAAPLIADPHNRLQVAGFAVAGFLWTLVVLALVGLGALAIASAAHSA